MHPTQPPVLPLSTIAALLLASSGLEATPEVEATPQVGVEAPPLALPSPPPAPVHRAPPLEVYRVRLAVDLPIMVAGAAAGLLRNRLSGQFVRTRCPCNADELNAIDRRFVGLTNPAAGLASDATVTAVVFLPPLLDLLVIGPSRAFAQDLTVFAEALLVTTLVNQVTNFTLQRPRPRTYAGDSSYLTNPRAYFSFYAGHVSNTAAGLSAAAYTLRLRYGEQVWPWVVTGLVTASVGAERLLDGQHFPTDVLVGALVGVGVGIAVPWFHARAPGAQVTIAPASSGRGLALVGRF
jgi:membrane-associated phospholipid phosphatase